MQILQNHFQTPRFTLNHLNQNCVRFRQEYWRGHYRIQMNSLQNLKTIGNYKKQQNSTKMSVKNIIFNKAVDLRSSSGHCKVA